MYTAISLFSGAIDGLGIAASVAGFNLTHHYEIDEWCCKVLRKNFPHSIAICEDIKRVTSIPTATLLVGSPPCQGWSNAGNGKGEDDPRNLWPDMLRLVKQSRPRCVLVENVRGGIAKGYIDLVCGGLEDTGYEAQALVYPAAVVGAPHGRERVFVVAHARSLRSGANSAEQESSDNSNGVNETSERERGTEFHAVEPSGSDVAHTSSQRLHQPITTNGWSNSEEAGTRLDNRLERQGSVRQSEGLRQSRLVGSDDGTTSGVHSVTQFAGFPNYMGLPQHAHEPPRTIPKKVPYHKERIAANGNAVVWQQAYPLMRGIMRWLQSQDN